MKIANPKPYRDLNLFFNTLIGIGTARTTLSLAKADNEYESHHTLDRYRAPKFHGGVYRLELGMEYALVSRKQLLSGSSRVYFFISTGVMGSFKNFEFFNGNYLVANSMITDGTSTENLYFQLKDGLIDNIDAPFNERLLFWFFSVGLAWQI